MKIAIVASGVTVIAIGACVEPTLSSGRHAFDRSRTGSPWQVVVVGGQSDSAADFHVARD